MTEEEFKSFWRDEIAAKNRDILHSTASNRFLIVSAEMTLTGLHGVTDGYVLGIEKPESGMEDKNSDNILDRKNCAFFILHKVKDTDHVAIDRLQSECVDIARSVITRLKFLSLPKQHSLPGNLLRQFDYPTINIMSVGPEIFSGWAGARVELTLLFREKLNYYDPAKWL